MSDKSKFEESFSRVEADYIFNSRFEEGCRFEEGWRACKNEILILISKEQKKSKKENINLCMINIEYLKNKIKKEL